jgi:hypothetical protein
MGGFMSKLISDIEKACLVAGGKVWFGANKGARRIYLKKCHLVLLVDLDLSRLSLPLVKALSKTLTYFDCSAQVFWTDSGLIRDLLLNKGFPILKPLLERNDYSVSKETSESETSATQHFNRQHYMERD